MVADCFSAGVLQTVEPFVLVLYREAKKPLPRPVALHWKDSCKYWKQAISWARQTIG